MTWIWENPDQSKQAILIGMIFTSLANAGNDQSTFRGIPWFGIHDAFVGIPTSHTEKWLNRPHTPATWCDAYTHHIKAAPNCPNNQRHHEWSEWMNFSRLLLCTAHSFVVHMYFSLSPCISHIHVSYMVRYILCTATQGVGRWMSVCRKSSTLNKPVAECEYL